MLAQDLEWAKYTSNVVLEMGIGNNDLSHTARLQGRHRLHFKNHVVSIINRLVLRKDFLQALVDEIRQFIHELAMTDP